MTGESNAKSGGEEVVYGDDAPITMGESEHTIKITLPKNIKKICGYTGFINADIYVDGSLEHKDASLMFLAPETDGAPAEHCRTVATGFYSGGLRRSNCDVAISGNTITITLTDSYVPTDTSIDTAAYTYIPE